MNINYSMIQSNNLADLSIEGYASKFDIIDKQQDIIKQNAFLLDDTTQIKLLWQHDHCKPIGVINDLNQDSIGLYIKATIFSETSFGRDAIVLIKNNVLSGLSVGFEVIDKEVNNYGESFIVKARLIEISVVTFPANEGACITNINKSCVAFSNSMYKLAHLIEENF